VGSYCMVYEIIDGIIMERLRVIIITQRRDRNTRFYPYWYATRTHNTPVRTPGKIGHDKTVVIIFTNLVSDRARITCKRLCALQPQRCSARLCVLFFFFFLIVKGICWCRLDDNNRWSPRDFGYNAKSPLDVCQTLVSVRKVNE
jgi:hypothetical protein